MAQNKVQIEISANDNASRVLEGIKGSVGGIGLKATALSFAFNEITGAINRVVQAFAPLVDAALTMEKINSTMKVAAGSSQAAGAELQFVRTEAQRLGLSFSDTATAFAKFSVAAKGTALEGEGARKVFSSVATASAALKLSTEETNGILNAMQQMMSKGTVQSEELKGQIGERLPGAFNLAAQAMGVTTAQLSKMLEQGQVAASDLLPKLAAELQKTYGPEAAEGAKSLQGSINKFNDAMKENAALLGQTAAPAIKVILGLVADLAKAFVNLVSWVEIFAIGIAAGFNKAAVYISALMNGDIFTDEGRKRLQQQLNNINNAAEESFKELEKKYGVHQEKMNQTGLSGAAKAEKEGQLRRDAAKKTGDDLLKIQQAYATAMGTEEDRLTAEYEKNYQERKKAITDFYNNLKTQATSNKDEEQFEKMKLNRLKELEQQHANDIKIIKARMLADALSDQQQAMNEEIALIRKQVADRVITEERGEQIITQLTVAHLKDQYEARKNVADQIAKIYGTQGEDYKKALKDQEQAHKAYTDANLAAYQKYAAEIKKLDQGIVDFRKSIEQKIADIKQKNMTDSQKYADNEKRYAEAVAKAKDELAKGNYDVAMKYAKEAEDLATRLADKKSEQNTKLQQLEIDHQNKLKDLQTQNTTGKLTDQQKLSADISKEQLDYEKKKQDILSEEKATQEGITNAETKLNEIKELGVQIMEKQKTGYQDAMAKLKEIQDMKVDPKNLQVNIDDSAYSATRSRIDELTKTESKVIVIEYVEGKKPSSSGYFAGGKVANGSPFRDSVSAMLAKNEWVINNRATRFFGDAFMNAVNTMNIPRLSEMLPNISPRMATTGGANLGTLNLSLGGESFPVSASVDVMERLTTAIRRAKLAKGV